MPCRRAFSSATTACAASDAAFIRCSLLNESPTSSSVPKRSPEAVSGRISRSPSPSASPLATTVPSGNTIRLPRADVASAAVAATMLSSCFASCVAVERLAEAGERLAHAPALGLELGESRLELRGHVVERGAELARTRPVPGPGRARGGPARDPAGGRGEAAEVPDDRPPLEVRDDADERQAREQPREEPVARACVGRVDHGLAGQDGEPCRRHSRQPRRDECAIARASDADGRALPGRQRRRVRGATAIEAAIRDP